MGGVKAYELGGSRVQFSRIFKVPAFRPSLWVEEISDLK